MTNGRLFVVTGPRGVGKTTLAATYLPPSEVDKVYYHDAENSANQIVAQLDEVGLRFGRYVSLLDRFEDLPSDNDLLHRINRGQLPWVTPEQKRSLAEYYTWILEDLDENLERGKYRVYVHDTLEKLEAGMAAWVELNKKAAGVTRTAYGGLWTDGVYPLYSQLMAAVYARGVETIILTSHLKTPWEDGRPVVGKVEPAGKKLLYQLSSLMLWLVNEPGNASGAPAGLVLKERLGKIKPTDGDDWDTEKLLPQRLPVCTWKEIRAWLDGKGDAGAGRLVFSQDEKDMISELLTDEQMRLMVLSAERELQELKSEAAPMIPMVVGVAGKNEEDIAMGLAAQGKTTEEIAEELGKPLPLVRRWLGE